MIVGIGTDIIEVARIRESIEKYGDKLLGRIFTPTEIEYCDSYGETRFVHYAARFAAKEAFSKALGTGISDGFKLNEFGIKNDETGKPQAELLGSFIEKYSDYRISLSLSHLKESATAFVIIERA